MTFNFLQFVDSKNRNVSIRINWLAVMLLAITCGSVAAMEEVNYEHFEASPSIFVDFEGITKSGIILPRKYRLGQITFGSAFSIQDEKLVLIEGSERLAIVYQNRPLSFVLIGIGPNGIYNATSDGPIRMLFDEAVCTVGLMVTVSKKRPPKEIRSSVFFEFLSADGQIVQKMLRMPAVGTTLQAFSISIEEAAIRGLEVTTNAPQGISVDNIIAKSCSIPMS